MARGWMGSRGQFDAGDEDADDLKQTPNHRCGFCGEGCCCEHGYCEVCQTCYECED